MASTTTSRARRRKPTSASTPATTRPTASDAGGRASWARNFRGTNVSMPVRGYTSPRRSRQRSRCRSANAWQRNSPMISHVHVGVTDFERAFVFYSVVMDALGLPLKFCERDRPWAGWMPTAAARPLFLIGRPYDGDRAAPGKGQMVALLAPTRAAVDACYAKAPWPVAGATTGRRAFGRTIIPTTTAPTSAIPTATRSASAAMMRRRKLKCGKLKRRQKEGRTRLSPAPARSSVGSG